MPTLLTPGVSFERGPRSLPPVLQRTDVAGFVGIAERGPLHRPQRLTSWREFQDTFGGFLPHAHLAYVVHAFFENGGRVGWVVRIADAEAARAASATIPDAEPGAGPAYRVRARSPGLWGNRLAVTVLPARRAVARQDPGVTVPADRLVVSSVAGFEPGSWVLVTGAPDPEARRRRRVEEVDVVCGVLRLDQPLDLPGPGLAVESVEFTLLVLDSGQVVERLPDLAPDGRSTRDAVSLVTRQSRLVTLERLEGHTFPRAPWGGALEGRLGGGVDGLRSLTVLDAVGLPGIEHTGLATLDEIDEVAILCMPDLVAGPLRVRARRAVQRTPIDPCDPRLEGELEEVAGTVRDAETGAALAGVAVTDGREPPELTDESGAFSLPGQLPGATIDVVLYREGYEELVLRVNVDDPAARTLDVPLTPQDLPPGLAREDIVHAQQAAIAQCEQRRDRFCLLDAPIRAGDARSQISDVLGWRAQFSTAFAALYYPWLIVTDPLTAGSRPMPPSGHLAGLYAATDLAEGVFRPPANRELRWVDDLLDDIGDAEQGLLNSAGVNALRAFPGRGIRAFGARTLAPPDAGPLIYVNVRRLLSALEESILDGLQWAVFEPNDEGLRAGVRLWLTGLADGLWRRGAFVGDRPDAAYDVRCDATTTPAEEAANGRLIAEVAVAPTVPYEFVLVRLGITADELQVSEV
jgi:hypothetical protein